MRPVYDAVYPLLRGSVDRAERFGETRTFAGFRHTRLWSSSSNPYLNVRVTFGLEAFVMMKHHPASIYLTHNVSYPHVSR
jgi:hypothetical protein